MIELALIAWAATWLYQNLVTETAHARRGTVSPRMQMKMEDQRQRGLAGLPPRYGSRDWAADLIGDFLRERTEKRRELKQEKVRARQEAWEQSRRAEDPLKDVRPEPVDAPERPVETPRTRRPPTPEDIAPEPDRSVPTTEPTAKVIPFNRKKEPPMTTTSAEDGLFLTTAIEHCKTVAAVHESHTEGGEAEDFVNNLVSEGYGSGIVNAVLAAMEASQIAAATWSEAAKKLEGALVVKEAYEQEPDAGSKESVTGGE